MPACPASIINSLSGLCIGDGFETEFLATVTTKHLTSGYRSTLSQNFGLHQR